MICHIETRPIAISGGLRPTILGIAAPIKAVSWFTKFKKFEKRVGDGAKQMDGHLCIRTVGKVLRGPRAPRVS